MSRLQEELKALQSMTKTQLLDKKTDTQKERARLENKLEEADFKRDCYETIDEDWYTRVSFAYKATGVVIEGINNELNKKKHKDIILFSDFFLKEAEKVLDKKQFEFIQQTAYKKYLTARG